MKCKPTSPYLGNQKRVRKGLLFRNTGFRPVRGNLENLDNDNMNLKESGKIRNKGEKLGKRSGEIFCHDQYFLSVSLVKKSVDILNSGNCW